MASPASQDELDAQDPFKPGARDVGYRIGARIDADRSRRPQLVATAIGVAIVGAMVLGVIGPSLQGTAIRPVPEPASDGVGVIPTRLPALTVSDSGGPTAPFPVLSGGLRWLDPRTGAISGQPTVGGGPGWIFVGRDGSALCVCYDSPWSQTGMVERLAVVRYDGTGHETGRTIAEELASPMRTGDAILRDVALAPDRSAVYVAWAIRDESGWSIQLDTIDLAQPVAGVVAHLDLGRVDSAATGTTMADPILRISPDGRRLRLAVHDAPRRSIDPNLPWTEHVWIVDLEGGGGGPAVRQLADRPTDDPGRCDGEAWATNVDYVILCRQTFGDTRVPMVQFEGLDGSMVERQVGDAIGRDDLDWLVDSASGTVYRWSRFSHVIARLDVRTGDVASRSLGTTGGEIDAVKPNDWPWPAPSGKTADWAQLGPAGTLGNVRLAGSADGSVLYAIGMRSKVGDLSSGPLLASTGVWVFEARTLALLARWPAAAMYDEIGLTPDGRFVLAAAQEGVTADGRVADWASSLAFHDARSGNLVDQIGDVVGPEGFNVSFLVPGPNP